MALLDNDCQRFVATKRSPKNDWRKYRVSFLGCSMKKPPDLAGGRFGYCMKAHDMDSPCSVLVHEPEEEIHYTSVNNFVIGKSKVLNKAVGDHSAR